ncbi:MAG: DNA-binding protein [Frankiales bacterium]|nr:DNA-binding protein [Frankiales bacterium]
MTPRRQEDLLDSLSETVQTLGHRVEAAVKPHLRGVLHEVAFAVSLVTGTAIVCLAHGTRERTAATIYAASVVLLFGTSAAYHRGDWGPKMHDLMSRLDHSMIFVLIAGTYTPFALLLLKGWVRWTIFGVVWGGAFGGILLRNVFRQPPRWVFVTLYLVLGWVAVAIMPQVLDAGGATVLVLLAVGGVFYSLGAVVYARKRPDPSPRWFGFHELFHAFTLAAFAVHYVAISLTVYST